LCSCLLFQLPASCACFAQGGIRWEQCTDRQTTAVRHVVVDPALRMRRTPGNDVSRRTRVGLDGRTDGHRQNQWSIDIHTVLRWSSDLSPAAAVPTTVQWLGVSDTPRFPLPPSLLCADPSPAAGSLISFVSFTRIANKEALQKNPRSASCSRPRNFITKSWSEMPPKYRLNTSFLFGSCPDPHARTQADCTLPVSAGCTRWLCERRLWSGTKSALDSSSRRCAIKIDNLYLFTLPLPGCVPGIVHFPSTSNLFQSVWCVLWIIEQRLGCFGMFCVVSTRPVESGESTRGRVSYPGPRDVWGHRRRSEIQSTPERAILKNRIQKNSPRRGSTRMFPRAPLWLSTSLSGSGISWQ